MFRNFITTSIRILSKRKHYTFVHILGLALAFGASILLFLAGMFEFSYDNFHENRQRIGLVYQESNPAADRKYSENVPPPLGPTLKSEIPTVEKMSRYGSYGAVLRNGDSQLSVSARFVDEDFLEIFSFPLINGSEDHALQDPEAFVITEKMANILFGHTDIVGKTLELRRNNEWETAQISAVLKDIPINSSLNFDILLRFEKFTDYDTTNDNWHHNNHSVFILWAASNLKPDEFTAQTRGFVSNHFATHIDNLKKEGVQADKNGDILALKVLPLADYHLNDLRIGGGGPPLYPWILILLAGLILFIAGSNFVNLSIASSFTRSKEIGMRKTMGSSQSQIFFQLWGESMLISCVGLLLGLLIAWLLIPSFNANMGYQLTLKMLFTSKNIFLFVIGFFIVSFISGGYPAWVLSRINTLHILRGKFEPGSKSGLRNTLTVVQFSIAVLLIVGTLIIGQQLNYLHSRPLGFNQNDVISIPIGNEVDREEALQRMRIALGSIPDIQSISGADINIGQGRDNSSSTSQIGFLFEEQHIRTNWLRVDYDYLETLELELVAGRDFSRSFSTDTSAIVINEAMAANFGGVEQALGKTLPIGREGMQIIGVVKNYNFQNLRHDIDPLTMFIDPSQFPLQYIFVKIQSNNKASTLAQIEREWKKINPNASSPASFLDENTAKQYERDNRFGNIIIGGATLAILIACMGLFGIALLTINKRVKEIGIRKVLGASVSRLVLLLSRDFIKLVGIGFLIGAPLAWWAGHQWLQTFAYKIDVGIWTALIGGSLVLLVALLTVSWQAVRAAIANPVDSLRDE